MSFWCLQFSQKKEQKQFDFRYHSSKAGFFVWFLGELKIPKIHFEINIFKFLPSGLQVDSHFRVLTSSFSLHPVGFKHIRILVCFPLRFPLHGEVQAPHSPHRVYFLEGPPTGGHLISLSALEHTTFSVSVYVSERKNI